MIHPTAQVDPAAAVDDDVEIGPFCVVMAGARIGSGTRMVSHVVVWPGTTIGAGNVIHPGAVLGGPPQDRSHHGEATETEIGAGNEIREGVTINCGTVKGGGVTRVGDHNLFMANSHLGHDVQCGSHIVLANNVLLAGHIEVGDRAVIGGAVASHHFVRIGRMSFLGGMSRIVYDAPPFLKTSGDPGRPRGINAVGLQRGAVSPEEVKQLKKAYAILFRNRQNFAHGLETIEPEGDLACELVQFLREWKSSRTGRFLEDSRSDRNS